MSARYTRTSPPSGGLSRRRFLGASAAGLVMLVPAVQAVLPAPVAFGFDAMPGLPVRGGAGPWIERELAGGGRPPRTLMWRCPVSGAGLWIQGDGHICLDEPGWGCREFDAASFSHGHPQEAVRRLFGETVLHELRHELERWVPFPSA